MATVDGISNDHGEPSQRVMSTAVRDQSLLMDGWVASHADSGTPGPHVRLWAPRSTNGIVLRTDQIPEMIAGLKAVGHRIDELWAEQGAQYVSSRPDWVDSNDPAVIRQDRINQLLFVDRIRAHLVEVAEILLEAEDVDDASLRIAALVELDACDVKNRLENVSLFSLTRTPTESRKGFLQSLQQHE